MHNYIVAYLILFGFTAHVLGLEPVLSTSGNTTILIIVDIHRNYDKDGTCSDPNWESLELAYSMWYRHSKNNADTGIEIYDGCASVDRTLSIVRDRLFSTQTTSQQKPRVASVVTIIEPEVSEAVSGAISMSDVLQVTIGSLVESSGTQRPTKGHLVVDTPLSSSTEVLEPFLKMLNWTYVTTLSDKHTEPMRRHQHLLSSLDETICVQKSLYNITGLSTDSTATKTDGVVIFTSATEDVLSEIRDFPPSLAMILVTQNQQIAVDTLMHKVIVFNEEYERLEDFVTFMSDEILSTNVTELLSEYFISTYNCSFNSTQTLLVCQDEERLKADLYSRTSGELFNIANSVVDFVSRTVTKALGRNCISFNKPECYNMTDIQSTLQLTDKDYLVRKVPNNYNLTWIADGSIQSALSISPSELVPPSSKLRTFVGTLNTAFPKSQCTSWCPACKQDGCNSDKQIQFDGNYLFTPGDIIIAGMFPLTRHLEFGQNAVCNGYFISENSDILVEAFTYAVQTLNDRYNDLLPNVTIGALVFDTCSDNNRITQLMMNFESCRYMFGSFDTEKSSKPVPQIVPAYITYKNTGLQTIQWENDLPKLQLSVSDEGKIYKENTLLFDNAMFNHDTVVSVIRQMEWKYVGLITSESARTDINIPAFFDRATNNGICIIHDFDISGKHQSILDTIDSIRTSSIGVFVIFADHEDVDKFFRVFMSKPVTKTWIVVESRKNWLDFTSVLLPSGSLLLQRAGKINNDFNTFIANKVDNQRSVSLSDSWLDEFKKSRDACEGCALPERVTDIKTQLRASDVIRAVDVAGHALGIAYREACVNETGLCRQFYGEGFQQAMNSINKVFFDYEGETVNLIAGYQITENYLILNIQSSIIVEIGEWKNNRLSLNKTRFKAYDSSGDELKVGRRSVCYSQCVCRNRKNNTNPNNFDITTPHPMLDPEIGFKNSSGKFNSDLWSIVVVIIAGSGAFATLCLMMYIMCKVCAGALVRRYLVLGVMLLIAMIFLFMSVLPFVFTPSEAVCGMRYFAHGVSYALCFAIILTKMTTLRDYKYIGLGGEISRINQLFSVFFITAVQVAIGVEWWVLRTPVLIKEKNSTFVGDIFDPSYRLDTYYACDFERKDFLAYHSFVIFLIFVCCLYSIGVRKETQNMKEARLLLISSWFCLAIWIALIVTISVMDRDYLEAICAIGILANALTLMVVIYFPKLTAISRLRYEISDQNGVKESGYKVDRDFHFERPYSLPGTLHSHVTDKSLSYQRSLAAFDTSLSY